MRFLVVADLLYTLQQHDRVIEMAPRFYIVIMAVDRLVSSSRVDCRAPTVVVKKYIGRLRQKTRLVVYSGNHDLDARSETGENVAKWIIASRAADVPTRRRLASLKIQIFTDWPNRDGPLSPAALAEEIAADARKRTGKWIARRRRHRTSRR